MEQIIKLPSQQSSFTVTNDTVDIVLPGNSGVYDLSQMYIVIDTAVTSDFGNLAAGSRLGAGLEASDAIADLKLHFRHNASGGTDSIYNETACPIEMLVKDCRMTSQSRGPVEDVRNSDSLRGTMKSYTQDLDDVEGAALVGMAGAAKTNPWANGRYAKLQGVGDVLSTAQTHELRIYLRDLYEICSVTDWDTAVYGDTTFSMTLRIDALEIKQVLGAAASPWNKYYHNTINTATHGPIVPYGRAVLRAYADGTPPVETTMTMEAVYPNIEDHPFWIGQALNITTAEGVGPGGVASTGTATGQVPANTSTKWCVVKAISWDPVSKQVTLDFGTTILDVKTVAGATGEGYFVQRNVVGSADQNKNLLINSVELNAVRRSDVASGPSSIQYSQWSTQADQFSSGSSLNRTYYLPARTSEVVIVLPAETEYGSNVLGSQRLGSYRFAINGEAVTNRAVPYMSQTATADAAHDGKGDAGSSLHYDLISKTIQNMGSRYSSLNECVYDQNIPINTAVPISTDGNGNQGWLDIKNQPQKRVFALMCPIPMSQEQTQFNLELDGVFQANTGRVLIYSHVASTI